MDEFEKQALTEHLADLRRSLVHSLIAVAAGFAVTYSWSRELGEWLFAPLYQAMPENAGLIFTSYQEGFFFT
jgi:Sec-independent protein secretion pathway component TatC